MKLHTWSTDIDKCLYLYPGPLNAFLTKLDSIDFNAFMFQRDHATSSTDSINPTMSSHSCLEPPPPTHSPTHHPPCPTHLLPTLVLPQPPPPPNSNYTLTHPCTSSPPPSEPLPPSHSPDTRHPSSPHSSRTLVWVFRFAPAWTSSSRQLMWPSCAARISAVDPF